MSEKFFTEITDAKTYLLSSITHNAIVKLINSYGNKLTIPDWAYFLSIDPSLAIEYNRVMNAYTLLFLRVQDAVTGNKSSSVKNDGKMSAAIVNSGLTLVQKILDRYVIRDTINEKNITLYRTKNPLLAKPLTSLENKIITKLDALLESTTITRSEYDMAVQSYNDFVLHLMIYRDYWKKAISKERAVSSMKVFMATYRKKVGDLLIEPTLSDELLQKQQEFKNTP